MNTKRFVTGSSVVLAGWLGATFLNEVPSQRYPKLDKRTAASETEMQSDELISTAPRDLPVTVSH